MTAPSNMGKGVFARNFGHFSSVGQPPSSDEFVIFSDAKQGHVPFS